MLLVNQRLSKSRTMDRILQPPVKLQDDWYQYLDRILTLSLLGQDEITCELLYMNLMNQAFRMDLSTSPFAFSFTLHGFSHSSIPG